MQEKGPKLVSAREPWALSGTSSDSRHGEHVAVSVGGVLTCWTIEHTERFRAAASLYPVINWYSFALTSDIHFITKLLVPGSSLGQHGQLHAAFPHQSCRQS